MPKSTVSSAANPPELREVGHTPPRPVAIKRVAESTLPTEYGEFRIVVYDVRDPEAHPSLSREYVALLVGDVTSAEALPVRLHSECLTGETFASVKCDCRAQLAEAQRHIQEQGRGCIVYLRQEGRGIGLTNKIRAYALQDEGADTIEANRRLNLPVDARRYNAAEAILEDLQIQSVVLLTNNPLKLQGLSGDQVRAVGRVPLEMQACEHSKSYLEVKRDRMGHLLTGLD